MRALKKMAVTPRWSVPFLRVAASVLLAAFSAWGQSGAQNGEWSTYGGDLGSTRYSSLDQINATNFNGLEIAWRFKTDNLGPKPEYDFQSTPLMVGRVLYSTGGTRRAVFALDAVTGELLWMHSENEGERGNSAPRKLSGRGLAYWSDGQDARILYVTPGYRLIALDAKTGTPISTFGTNGSVDLKLDDDQQIDPVHSDIGLQSAPIVAKNTIIIGAAHLAGRVPRSKRNLKGYVRGYDVRTGKRLWIFHTIPQPGEFGIDTWQNDSWSYSGNTGVWGQMSVDNDLGIVYLPVETPTGDEYGGYRPGNGLFGESLVALDLRTGKRIWHYQFIHHGIWDWDIPCAPILADITVNGRRIKAVAQPTKQAWIYTFDRVTGEPVWPIEERSVPQSDTPGERTSRTQPFPTKPPAFDRQGVGLADLIDFTPELRAAAVKLVSRYKIGPIFTPAAVSKPDGPLATLMLPATTGGANWPGGSFDPETGILYVFSNTEIGAIGLVKPDPKRSDMDWVEGQVRAAGATGRQVLSVMGLPLVKPPWGRITAIDMNKGEIVWQAAHGETADAVKNNPALKGVHLERTGRPGRIGTLVTKTLLIAGDAGVFTNPAGKRGAMLRAYDKASGKEVGAVYIPAPQTGSPMTYIADGKQYIVVAISGANYSGEILAFRLP